MEENKTIAILGATGAVGKEVAQQLARKGISFRVVGRSLEQLEKAFSSLSPHVEYCQADLSDPQQAAHAVTGVDTVIYVVGVPYNEFHQHPILTQTCLNASAAAGVSRYVHLSTLYSYGRAQDDLISEKHPREPHTKKGRLRKIQEDQVMAAHGIESMQTLVLCPPDFYGGDSPLSLVHGIFEAAKTDSTADVIGPVDLPHEFVYVSDLAATLIQLTDTDEAFGQRLNMAGSGRITIRELATRVYAHFGRRPRLRVLGKPALRILGVANAFLREFVEMHYLLSNPLFVDDSRLRHLLPHYPNTSYEVAIRQTVARAR